jgi:hypothetical protein
MVNTLRITSVAAVVLAALVLASVLGPRQLINLGMKNDPQLDRVLKDPNIIERYKSSVAGKSTTGAEQASPLVKQAEDLVKNLFPPKPPTPPIPPIGGGRGQLPPKPIATSAKFSLIGLCYSGARPEESLAYIRMDDNTLRWARQGDEIGHTTIRAIRRNSILCWDGSTETEMSVASTPDTANMLESPSGNSSAALSDNPAMNAAKGGSAEGRLDRIANQIREFQQNGDIEGTVEKREAVFNQMVSDLRSPPGVSAPPAPRPENARSGAGERGPSRSGLGRGGFRGPITARPAGSN